MKAKLVGAGIAAALAAVGIGTAVAGAAALDATPSTQRSTVIDRGGRSFIQDEQGQGGYDCPEQDSTAPEASPSATTSDV
jgi:hypothetical protein